MKHRIILAAILITFSVPAIAQTTRNVPGQYPTIQAGIATAQNGDTVLVAPGQYQESINFLGKAITMQSSGGPAVTTLVGNGSTRVVTFNTNESAASLLQGFTITGGGGGILCQNASPYINNCTISGNTTNNDAGGGIKLLATTGNASPLITNCRITGNFTWWSGGGIYGEAQFGAICSPTITLTQISGNGALGAGNSGSNSVPAGGGGVMFLKRAQSLAVTGTSAPTLDLCTIDGNSCQGSGGGIRFYDTNTSIVRRCAITNNSASGAGGSGGGYGGAVETSSSQLTLSGCLIIGNSVAGDGGGVESTTAQYISTSVNILNCTLAHNTAPLGSAISAGGNAMTVTNSIIWANTGFPVFVASGVMNVAFSDVQGGIFGSDPSNLSLDPRFIDSTNGDFHLASSSPCRNAGTNGVVGLPSTDLDGTLRIQGGTIDMGSDEVPVLIHAGTPDGLDLYAGINGAGDPLASTRAAVAGNLLRIRLASPSGTLVGGLPVLAAEVYPTGSPPSPPLAGVWLDSQAIIVYGALSAPPFGLPGLPVNGLEFTFTVPPGLTGTTLRMQGAVSSINALNGVYATSNATEVTF